MKFFEGLRKRAQANEAAARADYEKALAELAEAEEVRAAVATPEKLAAIRDEVTAEIEAELAATKLEHESARER